MTSEAILSVGGGPIFRNFNTLRRATTQTNPARFLLRNNFFFKNSAFDVHLGCAMNVAMLPRINWPPWCLLFTASFFIFELNFYFFLLHKWRDRATTECNTYLVQIITSRWPRMTCLGWRVLLTVETSRLLLLRNCRPKMNECHGTMLFVRPCAH